jgi:hypothetical protein
MDQVKLRALQCVRRFNFERMNRYQSVAEHSFFVALLAWEAAGILNLKYEDVEALVVAALLHDAPEAATGDIPHLVKAALPTQAVKELEDRARKELGLPMFLVVSEEVVSVVEFCDVLELAMYLREEAGSGNSLSRDIRYETHGRLVWHALWSRLGSWACGRLEWTSGPDEFKEAFAEYGPPAFLKH